MFYFALGVTIIFLVFFDVFHSVVLPRPSTRHFRISPILVGQLAWRPFRRMAARIADEQLREDVLGCFGPLMFLLLTFTWLACLTTGYAIIFWSIREQLHPAPEIFSEAFYFAGTSILTIGFGDVIPLTAQARATALTAGASGLALLGLCFSFIFNLQSFLYQREVPLAVLGSRVEGKFSGLNLLLQHAKFGTVEYLRSDIRECEKWLGQVVESHRDFPLLCYFRSTGRGENWITCLGSMLDMCNILTTCVENLDFGECAFFHRLGSSSAQLLAVYLDLPINVCELMSRDEFDAGYDQLKEAGFQLKDREASWRAFGPRRCEYAAYISALCKYYAAKEPRWICPNMPQPSGKLVEAKAALAADAFIDAGALIERERV